MDKLHNLLVVSLNTLFESGQGISVQIILSSFFLDTILFKKFMVKGVTQMLLGYIYSSTSPAIQQINEETTNEMPKHLVWPTPPQTQHHFEVISLKSISTSAATGKLVEKAKIMWAKKENESLYTKISIIKQHLKVLNSELSYQLIEYSFYGLSKSNISNITYEDEKRLIIIKNLIPLTCLTCSLVFQQWNVF